jgi:hypothetical protein
VSPPDTVTVTLRAVDPDGIDSVWVSVDSVETGDDGLFDRDVTARFRFLIGTGKAPGIQLPIVIRARDVAGFQVARDTFVEVIPP